jgi:hypothetical protein
MFWLAYCMIRRPVDVSPVDAICHRIAIDLAKRSFLRPDSASEIAEVVDRERNVRGHRFVNRLTVVDRFGKREAR